MGFLYREGWGYIAESIIQSNIGNLEHQLILSAQGNASKNELEREIEASISIIQRKSGSEDIAEEEPSNHDFTRNLFPQTSYSFQEQEFIAGLQYNAPALDYEKLWYGERKAIPAGYAAEQEYAVEMPADTASDMLTTQEAADTFMEIQYHAIQGNVYEVNGEDRRKFSLWIAFNPALFKLFESLHGLTRDVNYAAV